MNDQNIFVRISANVAQFKAQMGAAAAAVRQAGTDAANTAAKANAGQRKIAAGMVAVGVAAAAMAAASAAAAIQLEKRMQNVATIWTDSAVSIADAGQRVVDMSQRLPQSANTLAEGLYDVASSGYQGADALTVLEASGRAASAGLTDTGTAARAITAVLNAYGLKATAASTVSDVLFQTVNLGVLTFEQLANTMGDFVGSAAVAGVQIQDANAALATMTLSGISASESGTSLNRVLQEFIQPGEAMTAMLERMGYATGLEAIEAEGLQGIMGKLRVATGGNATAMAQLFPEIRALRGALALTSAEGTNYTRVAEGMTKESELIGATQRALEEQQKSTAYQFQILKNSVVAAAISFGQALLPALKMVIGLFQAGLDIWNAIPGPIQAIIGVAAVLVGIVVGLAGAFVLLAPAIAAAAALWPTFTAGISTATAASARFIATPIGAALAAVGAAVTIATGLWAKHKKEQADTKRRVDALKESLDAETGALTDQTQQLLRDKIVKDDLDKKAKQLGVSLEDLMLAMAGDEAASKRVEEQAGKTRDQLQAEAEAADKAAGGHNALGDTLSMEWTAVGNAGEAHRDLTKAIDKNSEEVGKASAEFEREKNIANATSGAMDQLKRATTAEAEAQAKSAAEAKAHADALDELGKAMAKAFDMAAATTAAQDKYEASSMASFDRVTEKQKQALEDRHEAEREKLDDTLELERERWEAGAQVRRDALAKAQEDELAALEKTHEAALKIIEDRHEEEDRLWELSARDRRNQLDDQLRAERHAMDARLSLLDHEYDKRKKKAQKDYERQREELEFLVRTTWGAQREAAIAQLEQLDSTWDEQQFRMEQEQDAEVQIIKDGQDDRERALKQGLDDQLSTEKDKLDDKQLAEVEREKENYEIQVAAANARLKAQKEALDKELEQQKKANDDDAEERRKHLERIQEKENTEADNRRSAARVKHQLTLTELKTQMDELNATHESKLADLKTIWERSGRNLSAAMLTELQALDPKIVAELADSGDTAFDAFMDSFKTSVGGVDAAALNTAFTPFNDEIKGLLKRVGEYGGTHLMDFMASGLTNDPQGAQKLKDKLLELIAPKEVSPGVWAQPKPGGGYYPVKMAAAQGGIFRFADGGEHHVAQYAPAGAWRVWAEPETGGESYIPWARSKRARSLSVLAQTANAFGYAIAPMANGGAPGGQVGGTSYNVTVNVRVAAGVDPDAVGLAVRREMERSLDSLARQVTVKAWRN